MMKKVINSASLESSFVGVYFGKTDIKEDARKNVVIIITSIRVISGAYQPVNDIKIRKNIKK